MAKRRKKGPAKSLAGLLVIAAVILAAIFGRGTENTAPSQATTAMPGAEVSQSAQVHFIDVGQGSCVLIQSGGANMLIDGGEKQYADEVTEYLQKHGVSKLDIVTATHPHTDHIGALPVILEEFPADEIIMPRLSASNTPTTKTYEDLLNVIAEKKIKAVAAKPGTSFELSGINVEILGPVSQSKQLNNMSVVMRVKVQSTTFMLLADAEKPELKEILSSGAKLSCDVIQMGHHGSETSLYLPLLNKTGAKYAVISCGKDNKYGLPDEKTIAYLDSNQIPYERTDRVGSIVFTCSKSGFEVG